jgi:hypothetical protein
MADTNTSEYRYERFELRHMLADMRFDPDGPAPGDRLPALDLETLEGERMTPEDLDRPHLFVFGSNTCPMTASAGDTLERLHQRFGEAVRFVLVQVREAHPGENVPQPVRFDEKVALAQRLRSSLGISFTVAVDDVDGTFHASLDPKPNAAYLVDPDGTIVFRSMWSSDEKGLAAALEAVTAGTVPARRQSTRMLGPTLGSIGYVDEVVGGAGPGAVRDLARSAPPMLIGARLASLFRRLPPQRRGQALLAASAATLVAVLAAALLI